MERGLLEEARTGVSSSAVDRTVLAIREMMAMSRLGTSRQMYLLVRDLLFDGDADRLRRELTNNDHRKSISLAQLAAHPACPLPKTTLRRWIRIGEVVHELAVALDGGLTQAHLEPLIGLRRPVQRRLLDEALSQNWSASEMVAAARRWRAARPGGHSRGGRRPRSPAHAFLAHLRDVLPPDSELEALLDDAPALAGEAEVELARVIERARIVLDAIDSARMRS